MFSTPALGREREIIKINPERNSYQIKSQKELWSDLTLDMDRVK